MYNIHYSSTYSKRTAFETPFLTISNIVSHTKKKKKNKVISTRITQVLSGFLKCCRIIPYLYNNTSKHNIFLFCMRA